MHIVIAHSHLNPGGVTRIIESQIQSLEGLPIKVLTGSPPERNRFHKGEAELLVHLSMDYLENKEYSRSELDELLENIMTFLKSNLSHGEILHFHNLNLGKNPVATYAVYLLAKEGQPVFNHAHDFAEDRAKNYQFLKRIIEEKFDAVLQKVLYPDFKNYHFGVLNSSDYRRLISYGIDKQRVLWLPNPVSVTTQEDITKKKEAKKEVCEKLQISAQNLLITYPVRVIKRKNIGEFILLSLLSGKDKNFAVTLPPKNPLELKQYEKWKLFCKKNDIGITFEAGNKCSFDKLMIGSDFCITTSYREGFGMVYLEPWLLNTPVVGRNIDYITSDFLNDGLEFPALYSKIEVNDRGEDFKDLSREEQMVFIERIINEPENLNKLMNRNKMLSSLFNPVDKNIISRNANKIKKNYSLEKYGIKLQEQYKRLVR